MTDNKGFEIVAISNTHMDFVQTIRNFSGLKDDVDHIMSPENYANDEYVPTYRTNIAGKNIYLVCTPGPFRKSSDLIFRIAACADASKRAGAKKITAVFTDLPFARQDRGPEQDGKMEGQPNTSEVIARILHANGVDRLLTLHMHSERQYDIYQNVYKKPGREVVYNITPYFLVAHYLLNDSVLEIKNNGENIAFINCDAGSTSFVETVRAATGLENSGILYCDKARKVPNNPAAITINIRKKYNLDNLKGKTAVFLDDLIDTGGTLCKTCDWLRVKYSDYDHGLGVPDSIFVYGTHAPLSGESYQKIQKELAKLDIKELVFTNSRPYISHNIIFRLRNSVSILRIANLYADAIINCCEQNIHPDDYYSFDSKAELDEKVSRLYSVKRFAA